MESFTYIAEIIEMRFHERIVLVIDIFRTGLTEVTDLFYMLPFLRRRGRHREFRDEDHHQQ